MDQQRHAKFGHALEHRHDSVVIGDARRRVRRGMGRVKLDRGEYPFLPATGELLRVGGVGQIAGHQRRKRHTRRQCSQNALAISARRRHAGHRRHQVRHHDRAGELARRERNDRGEHRAVAQVDVPIVRTPQGDRVDIVWHAAALIDPVSVRRPCKTYRGSRCQ